MGQIHSHLYFYYNEEHHGEYVLLLDLFLARWGAKFIGSKIGGLVCIITWHTCSQVDVTRNNKSTDELVSISIYTNLYFRCRQTNSYTISLCDTYFSD